MKSKLNKKLSPHIIVVLITLCFIPALALAGTPGEHRQDKRVEMKGHPGSPLAIWRNLQMIQDLALTENQVNQIKDIDFTFREKHLVLKAQLDSFHLQLDKAFSADNVDDTAILKIAQEVSKVQSKLFVQKVESRLALGKILTADQIKKMRLYDIQPQKKGPGHGEERKPAKIG